MLVENKSPDEKNYFNQIKHFIYRILSNNEASDSLLYDIIYTSR